MRHYSVETTSPSTLSLSSVKLTTTNIGRTWDNVPMYVSALVLHTEGMKNIGTHRSTQCQHLGPQSKNVTHWLRVEQPMSLLVHLPYEAGRLARELEAQECHVSAFFLLPSV